MRTFLVNRAGLLLWLAGLSAISASGVFASIAVAQPLGEARELAEQGTQSFERGNFQAALDRFAEANELAPNAGVQFNMGLCLKELERAHDAYRIFTEIRGSQEADATMRSRAEAQISEIRPLVARLHVDVAGDVPTRIILGDQPPCDSPCDWVLLPGTFELSFESDSSASVANRSITLRAGSDRELVVEPVAARARNSSREGAIPGTGSEGEHIGIDTEPRDTGAWSPGPLFFIGGGLLIAGGGGAIGFGLRTQSLHDEFTATMNDLDPASCGLCDEGTLMSTLTNVSIGVLAVGAALMALDLLLGLTNSEQ